MSPNDPGNPVSNAFTDRAAPVSPLLHVSVSKITSPVAVHIRIVSTNTSNTPYMPCRTGWSVSAVQCTIGALPNPASFENRPRAMP